MDLDDAEKVAVPNRGKRLATLGVNFVELEPVIIRISIWNYPKSIPVNRIPPRSPKSSLIRVYARPGNRSGERIK